jgi:glycosyltransferase involved in cell wall biosynthesis
MTARALVITTSYPLSAGSLSGRFVRELLELLVARGWRFHVLTPAAAGGMPVASPPGIVVEPAPFPGAELGFAHDRGMPDRLAASPWQWALVPGLCSALERAGSRRLKEGGFDLIWSHWLIPGGVIGARLAARHDLPHLATAHGGDIHMIERLVRLPLARRALRTRFAGSNLAAPAARSAARVRVALGGVEVAVAPLPATGDEGARAAPGVHPEKPSVPAPGPAGSSPSRPLRLLFLGRFEPIKGADLVLGAARHAAAGTIGEIVMAGAGSEAARLRALARDLVPPVRFPGPLEGAARRAAVCDADLLVAPSRRMASGRGEGLPHAASVALAAGTPVVAPRGGALGELIEVEGAGVSLPECGDDAQRARDLARCLDDIARDPARLAAMRAGACRAGAVFQPDHAVPRWDRILRSALVDRPSPPAPSLRVALVIPARDEERFLPAVLAGIPPWVAHVIVVDDGSRDGTWRVLERWDDPRAVRVRRARPGGVGAAILEGYAHARALGADAAVVVAADGQMDFRDLPALLDPLVRGRADYVQGNRFANGRPRGSMPLARRIGNRILSAATGWAAGTRVGDSQCGYTAASAAFMDRLDPGRLPAGYGFPAFVRIEAHRVAARVAEVPVRARYGDEVSGIHPLADPPRIWARIAWRGVLRRVSAWRAAAPRPERALGASPGEAG